MFMTTKPMTDRVSSNATQEFVWDADEHTEIHRFIATPIRERLRAHKAVDILDLGCGHGSCALMPMPASRLPGSITVHRPISTSRRLDESPLWCAR